MRIVLVAEVLGIGGLPNYVLTLARLLAASGDEIAVAHGNAPLPAHLEAAGLVLMHLPGLAESAGDDAAREAVDAIRRWAPDVVHVHLGSNNIVIERLLQSGLTLVRSFHDYTSLCLRRGRRRWRGDRCQRPVSWTCAAWGCLLEPPRDGGRLPRLANLSSKIRERDQYRDFAASVVASDYMAETLLRNGFSRARIHVVPHFSRFEDAATGPSPADKRPGVPGRDRPFELLFSGQAVSGKGLEILIAALKDIPTAWRMTVLADGPRLPHARALAEKLGLGGQIAFLGWAQQAETREHYRLADLLVIPSVWDDPAPLVGLEAMAFGTPLVGFAVGGIPDYLIDGETGVLVKETTPDQLHAGLRQAMADPDRVRDWGTAARNLIARSHTRAVHEAKLRGAYRAALGLESDVMIGVPPAACVFERTASLDSVR